MFSSTSGYQSYILRFWPELVELNQTVIWHLSLEDVETNVRYCFRDFSEIVDFLGARKIDCEKRIQENSNVMNGISLSFSTEMSRTSN